jgi:translation initiation factor 2 subunit 1
MEVQFSDIQIPERLYPAEFPKIGDFVMVRITDIGEEMIYCHILEYNRQGMLSYSEISRKKVRNIRQIIRVGNQECMEIIDVNLDKGYIDLSRKQIKDTEKDACSVQYNAARRMHTYFYRWSKQSGENLVENVLWSNYQPDQDDVYGGLLKDQSWKDQLPEICRERMQEDFYKMFEKKAEKHELNVEMVCYSLEGVRALQEAIDKGLQHSTDETPLQCTYNGKTGSVGNIFQLSTVTKSDDGQEVLEAAAETMKQSLSQYRSKFVCGVLDERNA